MQQPKKTDKKATPVKRALRQPVSTSADAEREAIFENLRRLAKAITRLFGRNCEVAIHDFRDLERSLVYLENSITGRKIGAPITNVVVKSWRKEGNSVGDFYNYASKAKNGHSLKSATTFIRNTAGEIIGVMCINFDLTDLECLQSWVSEFMRMDCADGRGMNETFAAYITETNDAVLDVAIQKAGKHPSGMNKQERLQFIKILDGEGAFLVKGMVDHVAKIMNVSIYTVYGYLRQLKSITHGRE